MNILTIIIILLLLLISKVSKNRNKASGINMEKQEEDFKISSEDVYRYQSDFEQQMEEFPISTERGFMLQRKNQPLI